jgi:hypothetical protein
MKPPIEVYQAVRALVGENVDRTGYPSEDRLSIIHGGSETRELPVETHDLRAGEGVRGVERDCRYRL